MLEKFVLNTCSVENECMLLEWETLWNTDELSL